MNALAIEKDPRINATVQIAGFTIGDRSSPPLCFIKLNVLKNLHSAKAWMTSTLTSIWTLSCPESLVVRVVHAHNTFLPAVVGWRNGEAQPEEFVEKTLSTLVRDIHIDCCVRVLVCPMGCPPRPCPFRHHFDAPFPCCRHSRKFTTFVALEDEQG